MPDDCEWLLPLPVRFQSASISTTRKTNGNFRLHPSVIHRSHPLTLSPLHFCHIRKSLPTRQRVSSGLHTLHYHARKNKVDLDLSKSEALRRQSPTARSGDDETCSRQRMSGSLRLSTELLFSWLVVFFANTGLAECPCRGSLLAVKTVSMP